jgi:hypothetical protein
MILYRGTLKPEDRPTPVEHHCAFFSTSWGYAMDYATQTGRRGYLQTYVAPDDLVLLDIHDPKARELGQEYLGRELPKPDFAKVWRDPLLELFRYPEKDWIEGLQALGYQGTTTGDDICVFDTSGFSLISQERVGGKRQL